jgi:pantothenate synthetase
VKLEGGERVADRIAALARMEIPVMGHVGLTPQSVHQFGGYRVQGRGDDAHERVLRDARAVEAAGAFAVVLECVPRELGAEITRTLSIPTIGIGAGLGCDGQVLVMHDLLGLGETAPPRFARQYVALGEIVGRAAGCTRTTSATRSSPAMLNPIEPRVIRASRTCSWSDATRARPPADRARADHGRAARGPPVAGAARLSPGRARGRLDLREPHPVRPAEDFARYPRDLDSDLDALRKVGADVVFAPSVEEIYPSGDATWVDVERLTRAWRAQPTRPLPRRDDGGGAALQCRAPARRHLRREGHQQLAVIRRMARDLGFGIDVVGGPIVREPDGLAMSSRNVFLSARARQPATALHGALHEARASVRAGVRDADAILAQVRQRIEKEPLAELDYVELVDADSLEPLRTLRGSALLALAVRFEGTRLIDNTLLQTEAP